MKNLRGSGAVIYYKEGHSILVSQKRLNHTNPRTTARYCDPGRLGDEHDLTIRKFQGEFVRASIEYVTQSCQTVNNRDTNHEEFPAETLFGFRCKDLFGGVAPGTRVGTMCEFFTGCSRCPGAIVVIDDPAIVARLLESLEALNDARERSTREGWFERYRFLYEPTREILVSEIFPAIHESVLQAARMLSSPRLVPFLE
jgi:hypothetical protein